MHDTQRLNNADQLLVLTNTAGRITYVSPAFCHLSGWPESDLLGQPIARLRHPDMPDGPLNDLRETLGRGESWLGMMKNRTPDGSACWVDAYISPISNPAGEVTEYQAIYQRPDAGLIQRTERVYRIRGQGRQPPELRFAGIGAVARQGLCCVLGTAPVWLSLFWFVGWQALLPFLAALLLTSGLLAAGNRGLEQLLAHCRSLVQHPIKQLIYTGRADHIGQIELSMRLLEVRLQVMVARVQDSSSQVVNEISQTRQLLQASSQGAQSQQVNLQQMAAAVDQFNASLREVATTTQQAADLAVSNRRQADLGIQQASDTSERMLVLADELAAASKEVSALADKSQTIERILDVIGGVAEQTNLLALNAAIEAARAGENGRGFAVVADEVRTLAQRTQSSTTDIQQLIQSLQQGTEAVVAAMQRSFKGSQSVLERVAESSNAMQQMARDIQHSEGLNQQIAAATEQQSQTLSQLADQLADISQRARAVSEQAGQGLGAVDHVRLQAQHQQALISHMRGSS
ncbi:MAG: PAS domain-containing protein [Pseudomonadaceae bacterium]|nr:MAG: PAS domain-containing protein [Pseudomonadaceae bacterium]